ncbi:MAG: transporter substrate-binding domain-containing protein [Oscillospiraceae bacterium]|nr:transporter substrate-binding domain-containing protein [Oscillospiraceae bacterium]
MPRTVRILCLILCFALLFGLTACSGSSGSSGNGYRTVDSFGAESSYVIAFREGDQIAEYVTAALYELAASGVLRSLSNSWFGENLTAIRGQSGAMDELWDTVPERTITVGIDITNMPMSYASGDGYSGFDVELASYLCGYLGWSMALYPIDIADADIELNSGNIDMAMGISGTNQTSGFDYSPAYLTSQYVLVTSTSTRIRRRAGLRNKTLGVTVADMSVLQQDESFMNSLGSVVYQTDTDGLFQALKNGEVDGILVSSVVAAYYMN